MHFSPSPREDEKKEEDTSDHGTKAMGNFKVAGPTLRDRIRTMTRAGRSDRIRTMTKDKSDQRQVGACASASGCCTWSYDSSKPPSA